VVIGAGFGGLGAARELRRAGIDEVVVLERADGVGGVWRDNTYPGAACDVPSPLYSWSWAPNPAWSRRYAGQAEILDYLERAAREEGLLDLVRTGQSVCEAVWDDDSATWRLTTTDGTTYVADVVVSAVGQLSEPAVPRLPGVETFAGPAFHSAQWRHDVDLRGRRVAVVGTGASAVQLVPGIVDDVASMTVFQRSSTWVLPRPDTVYGARHHRLLRRFPALLAAERRLTFRLTELYNRALGGRSVVSRPLSALIRAASRAHLRRHVADLTLRRALTPSDPVGCKRLLFADDWFPALTREHVELVTGAVTAVEPGGVRTDDGRLHEADVLIWGTGFAAAEFLRGIRVVGRDGRVLSEAWADGPTAHLGITVPGFPNLFCVYGPHTNLGGSSIIGMLEAQAGWIAQVARHLRETDARAVEVDPDAARRWESEMDDRLADTVWARCDSWYRQGTSVPTNWPGRVTEYQQRLARVHWPDLSLRH
jgi:cation diffusion facilitator CzcD-associated flavoprotein CzcO